MSPEIDQSALSIYIWHIIINCIDQSQPFNIAITGLNLIKKQVKIHCTLGDLQPTGLILYILVFCEFIQQRLYRRVCIQV